MVELCGTPERGAGEAKLKCGARDRGRKAWSGEDVRDESDADSKMCMRDIKAISGGRRSEVWTMVNKVDSIYPWCLGVEFITLGVEHDSHVMRGEKGWTRQRGVAKGIQIQKLIENEKALLRDRERRCEGCVL